MLHPIIRKKKIGMTRHVNPHFRLLVEMKESVISTWDLYILRI